MVVVSRCPQRWGLARP